MADQKIVNFRVTGQNPVDATPALYSNFLAVSRVGTDLQFEFIFLDLNVVAGTLEQVRKAESAVSPELQGKTVAKLVMPGATFLQLREHFETLYQALAESTKVQEAQDDRTSNVR